jgi:hypothetical protein
MLRRTQDRVAKMSSMAFGWMCAILSDLMILHFVLNRLKLWVWVALLESGSGQRSSSCCGSSCLETTWHGTSDDT